MNLLFVLHNWVGYYGHGGTELHVRDLVNVLISQDEHRVYILFPDTRGADLRKIDTYVLLDPLKNSTEGLKIHQPVTPECYWHEGWDQLLRSIIARLEIDLVHFFHLLHFPLSLPLVAQQSGATVVISLFDHFFISPRYQLMRDNKFCGYPKITLETCDLCLQKALNYKPQSQLTRRALVSELLFHADAIHYLCNDQKMRTHAAYPHLEHRPTLVMGLGLERRPGEFENKAPSVPPLNVCCIGNFDLQKGGNLLIDVMKFYRGSSQIRFSVFGAQRPPFAERLQRLAQSGDIRLHGAYSPDQLPLLLSHGDIALFASIWPETFVLALSEAWSCGLVPIAPRLGAFEERITHGLNGYLYDVEDPGSLIRILDGLAQNPDELNRCLSAIRSVHYPSLSDNVQQYRSLYERIAARYDTNRAQKLSRVPLKARPESWATLISPPSTGNPLRQAWRYYNDAGLLPTAFRTLHSIRFRLRQGLKRIGR